MRLFNFIWVCLLFLFLVNSVNASLLDNVVLHSSFNDTTDVTGVHNWTNFGATSTSSGCVIDNCYDFDGSSDYMTNDYAISYTNQDLSVGVWVEPDGISAWRTFLTFQQDANNLQSIQQGGSSTYLNKWRSFSYPGTTYYDVYGGVVSANALTHIGLVINTTHAKLYVNGVKVMTDVATNVSLAGILRIGSKSGGEYFDGSIDELTVWDRALSDNEISYVYDNESAGIGYPWGVSESSGSLPSINSVSLSPTIPGVSDNINCTGIFNGTSPVNVSIKWFVDDVNVFNDSVTNVTLGSSTLISVLNSGNTSINDLVICSVDATNNYGGATQTNASVRINTQPTININFPENNTYNNLTINFSAYVSDDSPSVNVTFYEKQYNQTYTTSFTTPAVCYDSSRNTIWLQKWTEPAGDPSTMTEFYKNNFTETGNSFLAISPGQNCVYENTTDTFWMYSSSGVIYNMNKSGYVISNFSVPDYQEGISILPDGNIISCNILSPYNITIWNKTDGSIISSWQSDVSCDGLAIRKYSNNSIRSVWVSDDTNNKLVEYLYNSTTKTGAEVIPDDIGVEGIDFEDECNLWHSNDNHGGGTTNKVYKYNICDLELGSVSASPNANITLDYVWDYTNELVYWFATVDDGYFSSTSDVFEFTIPGNDTVLGSPVGSISDLSIVSVDKTWVFINWSNPVNVSFNSTEGRINGSYVFNSNVSEYNFTGLSPDSSYLFSFYTWSQSGVRNNTAVSVVQSTNSNNGPVINSYSPSSLTPSISENSSTLFNVSASDDDGVVWYRWLLDGVVKVYTQVYNFVTGFASEGSYNVTVIVNDTFNDSTSLSWSVVVSDDFPIPGDPIIYLPASDYKYSIPVKCFSDGADYLSTYYTLDYRVNGGSWVNVLFNSSVCDYSLDISAYDYGTNFSFRSFASSLSGVSNYTYSSNVSKVDKDLFYLFDDSSVPFKNSFVPYDMGFVADFNNSVGLWINYGVVDCNDDGVFDYFFDYNETGINPVKVTQSFTCVNYKGSVKHTIGVIFASNNVTPDWSVVGCNALVSDDYCMLTKDYEVLIK